MQQERILSALKEPLGLSEDARLIPLTGGEVNHVYRLTDKHKDLVVKWTGEDAFSGINRFHQFVLQEQVSQRLLAPEPVWLSDDECLWVEKFIEGPTLSRSGTDIPAALGRILASIHDQPITARPLQLTKRWQHYIDSAKLSSTDPRVHRANELNERLHLDYEDDGVLALCHNDLSGMGCGITGACLCLAGGTSEQLVLGLRIFQYRHLYLAFLAGYAAVSVCSEPLLHGDGRLWLLSVE